MVGIDCSSILFSARQNVELNGLSHVVKLVYGKCEDLSRSELGLEEGEAFDVERGIGEVKEGESLLILPCAGHAVLTGDFKIVLAGEWHAKCEEVK